MSAVIVFVVCDDRDKRRFVSSAFSLLDSFIDFFSHLRTTFYYLTFFLCIFFLTFIHLSNLIPVYTYSSLSLSSILFLTSISSISFSISVYTYD